MKYLILFSLIFTYACSACPGGGFSSYCNVTVDQVEQQRVKTVHSKDAGTHN